MKRKKEAIILMTKVPTPGQTKTRLMPELSGEECAAFHQACLYDICKEIIKSGKDAYLFYHGETPDLQYCNSIPLNLDPNFRGVVGSLRLECQKGKDLGERLLNAGRKVIRDYEKIIFIGADLPLLTSDHINLSLRRLDESDIVIGPAFDGGYYLLGVKNIYEELYIDIPWSTSDVLKVTLDRVNKRNLTVSLLPEEVDIDRWEDLLCFYNNVSENNNSEFKNLISFQYVKMLIGIKSSAQF